MNDAKRHVKEKEISYEIPKLMQEVFNSKNFSNKFLAEMKWIHNTNLEKKKKLKAVTMKTSK